MFTKLRMAVIGLVVQGAALLARPVYAQAPVPSVSTPVPAATVTAPPAAPYSIPWQLRPTAAANVVRWDTSVAMYEGGGNDGSTVVSTLLASYKIAPTLAPLLRLGIVRNQEPGPMGSGTAFVNPILGMTWAPKIARDWRLAVLGALALPLGMGGDKPPGMDETAAAVAKGISARSAMDNAMFAVNYFVVMGGASLAYVAHGLTVQGEVTLLQLTRTRNEAVSPEAARTNATSGLHLGYTFLSWLSVGSELRYQRWLSTPKAVAANETLRDNLTVAVGPRFHFKVSDARWIRPGISYTRGLDKPLSAAKYDILQVDVPFVF